jgi:hypothetical protein
MPEGKGRNRSMEMEWIGEGWEGVLKFFFVCCWKCGIWKEEGRKIK